MQETTLVHHLFGGYLRNQTLCLTCGALSKSYDCIVTLTLELPQRVHSLESALAKFTAEERLDKDNKYKCDKCRQYVPAVRSCKLEVAPNVLQICLKRFSVRPTSSSMDRHWQVHDGS